MWPRNAPSYMHIIINDERAHTFEREQEEVCRNVWREEKEGEIHIIIL